MFTKMGKLLNTLLEIFNVISTQIRNGLTNSSLLYTNMKRGVSELKKRLSSTEDELCYEHQIESVTSEITRKKSIKS